MSRTDFGQEINVSRGSVQEYIKPVFIKAIQGVLVSWNTKEQVL